ncbi:MAG TPA: divalent metal cation transporter [Gaiellaceae bacterium]|nr:divalent metal cation transporter [Gaiellaceae bacterium]
MATLPALRPADQVVAHRRPRRIPVLLLVLGPGLMVMLADTDAGSIATAAQSGASWGYRLLLLELVLIPVLYLVMELTVRLGIATGKGHAELIREEFGARWAYLSVGTLLVCAVGALVTEFAGIAGIGRLFGLPATATVVPAAIALVALVVTGGYRRVEVVGITLGLFELAFIVAAVLVRPDPHAFASGVVAAQPLGNPSYIALIAANVGAVVMPWMVFYQQGAVVEKGLTPRDLRHARLDTALGAVATQVVMAAVLIAAAATLHGRHAPPLRTVADISTALSPALGASVARVVLALGVGGAALLASIVVSIAFAWSVAEAVGHPRSLDLSVRRAPLFYGLFAASVAGGAALVLTSGSLVRLSVDVEVVNALLLPLVLGFLAALAFRVLPRQFALNRRRRAALAAAIGGVIAIGLLWVGLALGL